MTRYAGKKSGSKIGLAPNHGAGLSCKRSHNRRVVRIAAFFLFVPFVVTTPGLAAEKSAVSALTELHPLSQAEMKQQTGGAEPSSINLASNQSSVTGDQIGGVGATGAVSANSLANNSGLTTLIANSGNQVVISQSTVVNVYLH